MEKPKLLIIDDDDALCKSLRDTIELEGYVTETVHTGEDGIKKVKSAFFNIVLLEMELPDSDGIKVLEKIKEISSDTEVIMFTTNAATGSVIKAMDRNAFSYLPKPFETSYLVTTLKRVCEKQRITFENRILYQQTVEEEREWENTFDAISDMISIHDKDFNIIRCNKAVIKKLNAEFGDIIGKKCHEVFHGRNDPRMVCPFVRCKESLKPESEEGECMGGVFLMSCFPRFDEAGKFNGVVHIARDITRRKLAEEVLHQYEHIVSSTSDMMALLDTDYTFLSVNSAYVKAFKLTTNEVVGKTVLEVFGEKFFKDIIKPNADRCLAGEEVSYQEWFNFPAYQPKFMEVHYCPYKDEDGNIKGIVVNARDITERKKAEKTLEQHIQELSALNKMSQQVSSSLLLDHVVQAALDGITTAVNPDLALLFLRDGDNLNLQGVGPQNSKYSHDETPVHRVGECLCGLAVREGKPMYSSDILNDPRCTWEECKKAGLRSFAALPLLSGDKIIGVLGIASGTQRVFKEQDSFLQTLSNDIATGLQNALLHMQVQRHAEELETKVAERTTELTKINTALEEKNKKLEHYNELFVGRELRINELKERIKELEEKIGDG